MMCAYVVNVIEMWYAGQASLGAGVIAGITAGAVLLLLLLLLLIICAYLCR